MGQIRTLVNKLSQIISPATEEKQDDIVSGLDTVGISNTGDTRINPAVLERQAILESNGATPVNIQDQHSEIIDLYMMREDDTFILASGVSIDDNSFTVEAGHSITVGQIVCFQEGIKVMQAEVLSVVTNTIGIDTPFDFAFSVGGGCTNGTNNMAVDGSVTPQIFRITPKNLTDGQEWDITRIIFNITDDTIMDTEKFGGIPKLTNGIVLRVKNGQIKNIFNAKKNGSFAERVFDIAYDDKAPAGSFGFRARRTFAGQSKNGVTIRLSATNNDELQIMIFDDLTGLNEFEAVAQGHYVTD